MALIPPASLGGSKINGFSPKQIVLGYKTSEQAMSRRILRDSWNTPYATGQFNGHNRIITPFRAVNNLGDFLARQNYVCGGSNQVVPGNKRFSIKGTMGSIISKCDGSRVPAGAGNQRFVSDSSDYTKYRNLKSQNRNYNDSNPGGNMHSGQYEAIMRVRR